MKLLLALLVLALMAVSGPALAADKDVLEGVVQSVSGDTLTVKTDEGRTTVVDVSNADRPRVALGEKVTVVGAFAPELSTFKARAIHVRRVPS
jgi:hypothetical protein